jgi:hypothetical protein
MILFIDSIIISVEEGYNSNNIMFNDAILMIDGWMGDGDGDVITNINGGVHDVQYVEQ